MGLVTCLGLDAERTWAEVRRGRCGLGPVASLESKLSPDKGGGEAPEVAHRPGESREVGYLRLALTEAIRQASGSPAMGPTPLRVGIVLGTTLHGMRRAGEFLRTGDLRVLGGFLAPAVLHESLDGLEPFGRPFDGPALTTCAACSSGLSSVGLALTLLGAGELDVVISGGYDAVSEYAHAGFDSLRVVAAGPVRPFCRGREGMKVSEGYGVLVLERAATAAGRGARALAAIRGYGESADAHHLTLPHPEGEGAARAIEEALGRAGAIPTDVGLIAAHATATPNNDSAEHAALARVFGAALKGVPVVAFKSHLGHTLGGAGAVELILSVLAMRDGVAPPTANIDAGAVEYGDLLLNPGPERAARIDVTLNTSLGFGGANTCVIAGRPSASRATRSRAARHEVAITGVGVLVPGAIGNDAFAARMAAQRDRLGAGESGGIPESAFEHLIASRRVRRMSEYVKLTLAATALALEDAGVAGDAAFAGPCSAILGTTHGSTGFSEAYYGQIVREGPAAANPVMFAEGVPNAGSAQLSLMLGLKGGCQTIIGARTAGLDALRIAALRIESGEWERAIVGSAEEFSTLVDQAYASCGLAGAEWSPAFGESRGFVTGAGAVTMILERRKDAEARRGRVRGLILRAAGASATGEPGGRGFVAATAKVLGDLALRTSNGARLVGSANATWIDRAEAAGAGVGRVMGGMYGWVPEMFSVGPLAAAAAVLLTGRVPGAVGRERSGSGTTVWGPEREVDLLATDYAGPVSGVRLAVSV